MDQLKNMMLFTKVVDHGSLRGAAKELGISSATVSSRLDSLEQHFQVKLLQRSTRSLVLTSEGRTCLDYARKLLAEIREFEQHLRGDCRFPEGTLTVSAPSSIANHLLLPVLGGFLERYPRICVELTLSQHAFETSAAAGRSTSDVMLRLGPLEDSSLIARRLGVAKVLTVASPAYLGRNGVPRSVDDLNNHQCIAIIVPDTGRVAPWRFQLNGQTIRFNAPGVLAINGAEGRIHAARAGLGITQAPDFSINADLKSGRLVSLLHDLEACTPPLYVLYEKSQQHSHRVTAFVDYLLECFPVNQSIVLPVFDDSIACLTTEAP